MTEPVLPPAQTTPAGSKSAKLVVPRARDAAQTVQRYGAVGIFAASIIAVCLNILVYRFYKRWDVTNRGVYTLSHATLETLHALDDQIDIVVFLSSSNPLSMSVRQMLTSYGSETTKIHARYVDPDRNAAEFLALQRKYGIVAGKTEDGQLVTDASLVIARADRYWYVSTDDMVVYDEKDGRARPSLEQALTEGIRNVFESERVRVCFTTGHQEISIDDGGPTGLAELRYRLEKNNYEVKAVDLTSPARDQSLTGCAVVAVVGPEVALGSGPAQRLKDFVLAGGSALVLSNPILDEDNRIRSGGLEPLLSLAGMSFHHDFVIEQNIELAFPGGLGERFLATPKPHAINRGLFLGDEVGARVLIRNAQSLSRSGESRAVPLLKTSDQSFAVDDIRPFVEEGRALSSNGAARTGPLTVAMAAELPAKKPTKKATGDAKAPKAHGARIVAAGSANLVFGRNFREAPLRGTRLFIESAVSWLAAQPPLVSVPQKQSHPAGIDLTEEGLASIFKYVLLYLPAGAIVLGFFAMYRRRVGDRRRDTVQEAS
ncbi:MAG: GldG family protein [Polyangiaceae bacterium]|nr:GldG family protein [Polyangiaceae bacterium]